MTELIGYVIRGIPFGCVFGLVAVGLVLTYKTSGVFNLAFAAQAFASAAVFYTLRKDDEWDILPAFIVSVVVLAPLSASSSTGSCSATCAPRRRSPSSSPRSGCWSPARRS